MPDKTFVTYVDVNGDKRYFKDSRFNPSDKTSSMTNEVGLDPETGKLYSIPGSGGGGEGTPLFIVKIENYESSQTTFIADKSLSEIQTAYSSGFMVKGIWKTVELDLYSINDELAIFQGYRIDSGNIVVMIVQISNSQFALASESTIKLLYPDQKTSEMTQSVGMDQNGKLWTTPGSGGGEISDNFIVNITRIRQSYISDKSHSEISDAVAEGKNIIAKYAAGQYLDEPYIYLYEGYDSDSNHVFFREDSDVKHVLIIDFADGVELITSTILDPETKTSEMTQSVGMDQNGKLWTTPGSEDFVKTVNGKEGSNVVLFSNDISYPAHTPEQKSYHVIIDTSERNGAIYHYDYNSGITGSVVTEEELIQAIDDKSVYYILISANDPWATGFGDLYYYMNNGSLELWFNLDTTSTYSSGANIRIKKSPYSDYMNEYTEYDGYRSMSSFTKIVNYDPTPTGTVYSMLYELDQRVKALEQELLNVDDMIGSGVIS